MTVDMSTADLATLIAFVQEVSSLKFLTMSPHVSDALKALTEANKDAFEDERARIIATKQHFGAVPMIWRDLPTCLLYASNETMPGAKEEEDGYVPHRTIRCADVPFDVLGASHELRRTLLENGDASLYVCMGETNEDAIPDSLISEDDVVFWLSQDEHNRIDDIHPTARERLFKRPFVMRLLGLKDGVIDLCNVPWKEQDTEMVLAFIKADAIGHQIRAAFAAPPSTR